MTSNRALPSSLNRLLRVFAAWLSHIVRRKFERTTIALMLIGVATSHAGEVDEAAGIEFFENRIRPVLVQHCYKCHSDEGESPKGDLRVDSRQAIRSGGESGHGVVPHDLDASLILSALRYEDFEMPPAGPLDEAVVADFATWIKMALPDPRDEPVAATVESTLDLEGTREFWAFQPPVAAPPPTPAGDWAQTVIDRFLAIEHERAGVVTTDDANPATLLRRVYFDLVGLPPSSEAIRDFERDSSPAAFQDVVDRLLDSPQFGERWGRHWLDIVRYAESTGRTRNFPYPFAWRYRDYVIRSLNDDKPYDQFVREQLAGDLLDAESAEQRDQQRIATGFLAMGAYDLNERNNNVFLMDVVGDQIDVTSRALMALTIGCARCHDHKFDPIPTHDYYAMAGIFRSTEVLNGYTNRRKNNQYGDPDLHVRLEHETADRETTKRVPRQTTRPMVNSKQLKQARSDLANLKSQLRKLTRNSEDKPAAQDATAPRTGQLRRRIAAAEKRVQQVQQRLKRQKSKAQAVPFHGPYAMGVRDRQRTADCAIHRGGDVDRLGERVPRGFLQVVQLTDSIAVDAQQSGRLELAMWLTQPDHPLTSRVFVNRVWHHLFGQGLVRTVDNFGQMGSQPTHPELLDHLAIQFVQEGWSIKRLIRSIVLTRAYQLSSRQDDANMKKDPDNHLVWRMPLRRLEAEAIRDAILSVSGQLKDSPPDHSIVQDLPIAQVGRRGILIPADNDFGFRSVYLPIVRSRVPDYLNTFDFPEPSEVKGDRDVTTVATQALFMMNSPMIQYHSRLAAERLLGRGLRPRELVEEAYLMTLSRPPTEAQVRRVLRYARDSSSTARAPRRMEMARSVMDLIHALIASAEFRYR